MAHIVAAGTWIGIDVLVAVMVSVGWFADDTGLRITAYRALSSFALWPMLMAGLLCMVSGIVLGLGSTWGLFRFRWVLAKLLINTILVVLIVVALRPVMAEVTEHGDALAAGRTTSTEEISTLFYPPAVSLIALTFATILAVFKPWGRMRPRSVTTTPSSGAPPLPPTGSEAAPIDRTTPWTPANERAPRCLPAMSVVSPARQLG